MAFWEDLRSKVLEHTTASDIAFSIKRKLATTQVNELALVKPAYYLGQVSVITMDYMDYIEKLLGCPDGDKASVLETMLYVRECAKNLALNVRTISEPLELALELIEAVYEGEELTEEGYPEEIEPGIMEPPPGGEIQLDEDEELEDSEVISRDIAEDIASREDFSAPRTNLEEDLLRKLETTDCSENITEEMAAVLSDVYLECVQLAKDLARLAESVDGDLPGILSGLVDIQYGLDCQLRGLLLEDVQVEEEISFTPGMLTWSALYLNELTESMVEEF